MISPKFENHTEPETEPGSESSQSGSRVLSRDIPGGPVGKDSELPMQGAWVGSLLGELDPTCHN